MTTAPPRRRRRLAPLLAAAASLLLSAPAAVLAQDGVDDDAAVGSLPTVYASTQSAAGHMFDVRPKKDLVVYGLEVNVIRLPDPVDVLVYTKAGSHAGSEGTEGDWTLWLNATVESFGLDRPTPVPQRPSASDPVAVARGETRAFYVALGGPYLRYSEGERLYYQNRDLVLFGSGSAKRQGWRGVAFSPRTFNGAVHYWLGTDLGAHPPLLPGGYTMEPTGTPTDAPSGSPSAHPSGSPSAAPVAPPSGSPSLSAAPTVSAEPTADPTATPTGEPSRTPTEIPTGSPIETERFESVMEGSDTRPVYVYAGAMFDLRAKTNVEVTTVAFNTYKFTPIPVWLYMRPGGFGDVEDTLEGWTLVANTTVTGRGMGNPTYIPEGTFSPVLVRKGTKIGFYVTTDGPFLRSSMGTEQGKPYRANSDLVLYEGVGKRYPVENGSGAPRIFNGVVGYQYATIPTSSPTIDLGEFGIRVVEHTFPATDDTFVQRGVATGHGDMTQLRVDGVPERVALMRFDLEGLNGHRDERHRPRQIISAVLRLYAIADSGFGGTVEAYPDGELDGSTATWDTVPYGTERGDAVGVVGSVHDPATGTQLERTGGVSSGTHYEVDIGRYLDANLSRTLVLAVRSDSDDGVMYRSSDSAPDGRGPALVVTFAYDPRDSPAMARTWGTDQPTSSPTVDPRWEDSVMPADAGRRFFNYDVGGVRGPESWGQAEDDGYYDQFRRLKTSRWSNKCGSGRRQSPRDVCQTNAKCQEFHETRPRVSFLGCALELDGRWLSIAYCSDRRGDLRVNKHWTIVYDCPMTFSPTSTLTSPIFSLSLNRNKRGDNTASSTTTSPSPRRSSTTTSSGSRTRSGGPSGIGPSPPAATSPGTGRTRGYRTSSTSTSRSVPSTGYAGSSTTPRCSSTTCTSTATSRPSAYSSTPTGSTTRTSRCSSTTSRRSSTGTRGSARTGGGVRGRSSRRGRAKGGGCAAATATTKTRMPRRERTRRRAVARATQAPRSTGGCTTPSSR